MQSAVTRYRTLRLGLAVAMLTAALAGTGALHSAEAQTAGQLTGTVPAGGGFGLAVWGGGTTAQLQAAASQRGCALTSAWVTVEGDFAGYVFGAPDFVNARFVARFPGLNIGAGTPLIVVCRAPEQAVDVTEREFAVEAAPASVPAGVVTFRATNRGRISHELVVVRSELDPGALPQRFGDVDESRVEVVGRTGEFAGGDSTSLRLTLAPGAYVLLCNLPAHYQTGMRTRFTVQ